MEDKMEAVDQLRLQIEAAAEVEPEALMEVTVVAVLLELLFFDMRALSEDQEEHIPAVADIHITHLPQ
jgi:hypothetical protein